MSGNDLDVPCTCSDADRERCGIYVCTRCERTVPWCFGAADQYPEWCDDCWHERVEAARARLKRIKQRSTQDPTAR